MNDLLSLFDEIETKPVNMIPETDRMIVDNYWNLFMEKFNGWRETNPIQTTSSKSTL